MAVPYIVSPLTTMNFRSCNANTAVTASIDRARAPSRAASTLEIRGPAPGSRAPAQVERILGNSICPATELSSHRLVSRGVLLEPLRWRLRCIVSQTSACGATRFSSEERSSALAVTSDSSDRLALSRRSASLSFTDNDGTTVSCRRIGAVKKVPYNHESRGRTREPRSSDSLAIKKRLRAAGASWGNPPSRSDLLFFPPGRRRFTVVHSNVIRRITI